VSKAIQGAVIALLVTLAGALLCFPAYGQLSPANQQEYSRALTTNGRFGSPRYSTAGRPACSSVILGGLIWNTTTATEQVCNGSTWVNVTSPLTSITVGTTTTAGTATCVIDDTMGGASTSDNFMFCNGTLPTVLTAAAYGARFDFAGAGSSAFNSTGIGLFFGGGYSGPNLTTGLLIINNNTGTEIASYGNVGISALSTLGSTAGYTTGGVFAGLGSTVQNTGVYATAVGTGLNVGVHGTAASAAVNIGGLFRLTHTPNGITGYSSAALIADNVGAASADIFRLYDNTTLVHVSQDGGSTWDKIGTKALTLGGGAVNFVRVDIASNTYQGGVIYWTADATDATEYQQRSGILPFSIVNKGGTETCTVGTPGTATESVAVSAGTFTVAFTTDTSPTNGCNFAANGTSSLTETVMRLNYHVRLYGNVATAVTAL